MKEIIILCGPTGGGKTSLALELSKYLPVEVISADSRQIYKDMNIGTCKPDESIRKELPHHLIDIITPREEFSAMEYIFLADKVYEEIIKRGKIPLIVGGTGFYIRTFEKGLCSAPGKDEEVRAYLSRRMEREGKESLYEELKKVDPIGSQKINPGDKYRLIRYLEVYYITGKPISYFWEAHREKEKRYASLKICVCPPREELYLRLEKRSRDMIENGLIEEVKRVMEKYGEDARGLTAIGYKEFLPYIKGQRSFKDSFDEFLLNTKHYAKYQISWFKKENAVWVEKPDIAQILDMIKKMGREVAVS